MRAACGCFTSNMSHVLSSHTGGWIESAQIESEWFVRNHLHRVRWAVLSFHILVREGDMVV